MMLRKRAEEILDLVKKATNEITSPEDAIAGDIYIGAGETDNMRLFAKAANGIFGHSFPYFQRKFIFCKGTAG